ncbi:hypothetical protein MTO96_047580 [Rhipicephalus appendiculatus]
MAKSAEKTDQCIAVYEGALQMVLPLDNPDAIHDLVFTNCFCSEWPDLSTQISRMRQLKCVHLHYHVCDTERRVTWLRGQQDGGSLYRDRPCISCCSTATFIGLVKPVKPRLRISPP